MNRIKKTFFLFIGLLLSPTSVGACSVCFSSVKTDPIVIALKWAIGMLLGTVGFVLFYFAKFFIKLVVQEEKALKNI